jgi:hypothetical protein
MTLLGSAPEILSTGIERSAARISAIRAASCCGSAAGGGITAAGAGLAASSGVAVRLPRAGVSPRNTSSAPIGFATSPFAGPSRPVIASSSARSAASMPRSE